MIGRIRNALLQYILDAKIKKKLFITFFLLIIIPLLVFTLVAYNQIAQVIQNNTIYSARQSLKQAAYFLSSKVSSAMNISDLIILDAETNKVFRNMSKTYELSQQIKDFNNLKIAFLNLQRNKDIFRVRLFIPGDLVFTGDKQNFFSLGMVNEEKWYKEIKKSSVTVLWYPTGCLTLNNTGELIENKVLSALRIVKSPEDYSKDVGVLSVDILESDVNGIIKEAANITKTGIIYLEGSNGIIQTSSTAENTQSWRVPPEYFDMEPEGNLIKTTVKTEEAIVGYKTIAKTGWRLVFVIPLKDILSSSIGQRNVLILLMLVIGLIAYMLACFISISSTKRIYQLVDNMRKVQHGNLDVSIANRSKDEIGELTEVFNYMIIEMSKLIEKQIKIGQEVKNAELKIVQAELRTLQAQINPHFLYNTLDMIYWMANKHDCPDIVSGILLLSRFYKLSLSRGKDIVTIGDEVLHIQAFIGINNLRFENNVKLELYTDGVEKFRIPKITLQPLVENSILHGIQKKSGRNGTIRISGVLENDTLILSIDDDGVGMSEEQIKNLFLNTNPDDIHGFGVKNINERLKLYFGDAYGLTYKSIPGVGTTAEIRIPQME